MTSRFGYVATLVLIAVGVFFWSLQLDDLSSLETFAAELDDVPAAADPSPRAASDPTPEIVLTTVPQPTTEIVIGFDGDLKLGARHGGISILAALQLVAAQVNEEGGVLKRKLRIVELDHSGMAARGAANVREFARLGSNFVFSGVHSPVALSHLEYIHENDMLLMVPWAAATPIVENGYRPNNVFRLSVRDEFAGEFLVREAVKSKPNLALVLENTGWGRSNEESMTTALATRKLKPTSVHWFNWGETDFTSQIEEAVNAGAEAFLLVANPSEGGAFISALAASGHKLPVYSHWGITAGDFGRDHKQSIQQVDLRFLQTELGDPAEREYLYEEYKRLLGKDIPKSVSLAPVGFSNAYDLIQLLVQAIEQAQSTDTPKVRAAMESLAYFDGLVRDYDGPFDADWHEALDIDDFVMCQFDEDGQIQPAKADAPR